MNILNKCFFSSTALESVTALISKIKITYCFNRTKQARRSVIGGLLATALQTSNVLAIETDQIQKQQLEQGQVTWLDEGENRFFSIFMPDLSGSPKGGVIILHDAGSHPNQPEVIAPIRTHLPLHGWATIAIQLKPLKQIADYAKQQDSTNKRVDMAVEYMQQAGLGNLVLLGHGSGAMAASAYLANEPSSTIRGFVAISLAVLPKRNDPNNIPKLIENISLPILDIYGSRDLSSVTNSARDRSMAARISSDQATRQKRLEPYMRSAQAMSSQQNMQGYIAYRQIRIEGASHDFRGSEAILTKRIVGWLERHAKGVAVNQP